VLKRYERVELPLSHAIDLLEIQTPSSADIVNKLLSPGPSDPNVPLPRADLAGQTAESGSSKKPQIFGRGEDGGGVFGLRVPIPADRNASGSNTRYSPR